MLLSMYDISIPTMTGGFAILSGYLDTAAAHAEEHDIEPFVLIKARAPISRHAAFGRADRAMGKCWASTGSAAFDQAAKP
jgi:hypothetical protein